MDTSRLLTSLHQRWRDQQDELTRVITPLTAEQLALRAASHLHSIGEMVAHLVAARVRMLGEDDPETAPMAKWDDDYAVAHDLVVLRHGLTSSWQMIEQTMQRWRAANGLEAATDERRALLLSYALKHEFHHGGELSLTLGMHGLEAPEWK
ncbi:MAG: DinB family protein [Caldilineaceae bacterium]